jgi:hypothetical protein
VKYWRSANVQDAGKMQAGRESFHLALWLAERSGFQAPAFTGIYFS